MEHGDKRLETLSNIAGAKPHPDVWELFAVLDSYQLPESKHAHHAAQLQPASLLRDDDISPASEKVKEIIMSNAPQLSDDNQVIL